MTPQITRVATSASTLPSEVSQFESLDRLLDLLDQLGIKAIFFVTSESFGNGNPWEREHADIVREIVRRGHTVGNHTETHRQLPLLRNEEIEAELRRSAGKIAWTIGRFPRLIRPPGGARAGG